MHVPGSRPTAGHFTDSVSKKCKLFTTGIWATAIKIKRNFCDHVSINKLSSVLTLLGKGG